VLLVNSVSMSIKYVSLFATLNQLKVRDIRIINVTNVLGLEYVLLVNNRYKNIRKFGNKEKALELALFDTLLD
jgi:ACR3 family arsenite efflux pump ArsB